MKLYQLLLIAVIVSVLAAAGLLFAVARLIGAGV